MRLFLVGLMVLILSGCVLGPTITEQASDANDEAVRSAEFVLCRGASVGSIRRAFGDRPEVWAALCKEPVPAEFVRPSIADAVSRNLGGGN
jgi:hypothetical protein